MSGVGPLQPTIVGCVTLVWTEKSSGHDRSGRGVVSYSIIGVDRKSQFTVNVSRVGVEEGNRMVCERKHVCIIRTRNFRCSTYAPFRLRVLLVVHLEKAAAAAQQSSIGAKIRYQREAQRVKHLLRQTVTPSLPRISTVDHFSDRRHQQP